MATMLFPGIFNCIAVSGNVPVPSRAAQARSLRVSTSKATYSSSYVNVFVYL